MEDKEIIANLKDCKTVDELKTLGKEIGYELSDDEAQAYLDQLLKSGELSDGELDSVTGGCAWWRKGSAYSGNPPHHLIVTIYNCCSLFEKSDEKFTKPRCRVCRFTYRYVGTPTWYCSRRDYYNDPLNPNK